MNDSIYTLEAKDGLARAGMLKLPRGSVQTPVFMPVGTQATVKAMGPDDLEEIGAGIILSNAYHLYLRPGAEIVENCGGLHGFMNWGGLVLTDSGGYQVFSLKDLRKIRGDGVEFRSHLDGSTHIMSPEGNMRLQASLGADIVMAFDVCPPSDAPEGELARAVELTTDWARQCAAQELKPHQRLFGIVQGGLDRELRQRSAESLVEIGFPGYAIGGLSVGEEHAQMVETARFTAGLLPEDRPRYLMGVGMPLDIVRAVEAGIDMFDCVLPTRMARNGTVFTSRGRLVLRGAACKADPGPLDEACECYVCRKFSRAYLRHLFNVGEIMAARLATFHNLSFYVTMMRNMRLAILEGRFGQWKSGFENNYLQGG